MRIDIISRFGVSVMQTDTFGLRVSIRLVCVRPVSLLLRWPHMRCSGGKTFDKVIPSERPSTYLTFAARYRHTSQCSHACALYIYPPTDASVAAMLLPSSSLHFHHTSIKSHPCPAHDADDVANRVRIQAYIQCTLDIIGMEAHSFSLKRYCVSK